MSFWNVLLVIIVILAILLVVLYILGSRMQKRQAEQQTMIDASKQTVSILAIDKKKLKIGDSGLPKMVIDQWAKLPIVKAKIGPKVVTMIADEKVFLQLPLRTEAKVVISGLYITEIKSVRGGIPPLPKKKKFFDRFKKNTEEAAKKAAQTTTTMVTQNASVAANCDEVTLLAALIQCEAGSECYEGQLAVGAVVMNRLRSGAYPSSLYDVIYQSGQFTPAGNGKVASVISSGVSGSCLQAAQEALSGVDNTGGALSFRRTSSGQAGVVIGNHVFF